MFQKILVVLDRSDFEPQVIQKAFNLAQLTGAKLALLHVIALQESTVLLLSEVERQKDWAEIDLMCWNAWGEDDRVTTAPAKLVRPKTKIKVAANITALDPSVLNHLNYDSDNVAKTCTPTQSRKLEHAIVDITQLCKADLIVIALPQSSHAVPVCYNVLPVADCPVLIFNSYS
jgi:nucleotide-binding universal stress UspA family protein